MRAYPDNAGNKKNQRFLNHILPKSGIINEVQIYFCLNKHLISDA